jgi:hypothetical protein
MWPFKSKPVSTVKEFIPLNNRVKCIMSTLKTKALFVSLRNCGQRELVWLDKGGVGMYAINGAIKNNKRGDIEWMCDDDTVEECNIGNSVVEVTRATKEDILSLASDKEAWRVILEYRPEILCNTRGHRAS